MRRTSSAKRSTTSIGSYPIAITGGYDCANPQVDQAHPIVGFATVRLDEIRVQGAARHIRMAFRCPTRRDDERAGGAFHGTRGRPVLVR